MAQRRRRVFGPAHPKTLSAETSLSSVRAYLAGAQFRRKVPSPCRISPRAGPPATSRYVPLRPATPHYVPRASDRAEGGHADAAERGRVEAAEEKSRRRRGETPRRRRGERSQRYRGDKSRRRRGDIASTPWGDAAATPRSEVAATPRKRSRVAAEERRRGDTSRRRRGDVAATPWGDAAATPQSEVAATPWGDAAATPRSEVAATPRREVAVTPRKGSLCDAAEQSEQSPWRRGLGAADAARPRRVAVVRDARFQETDRVKFESGRDAVTNRRKLRPSRLASARLIFRKKNWPQENSFRDVHSGSSLVRKTYSTKRKRCSTLKSPSTPPRPSR